MEDTENRPKQNSERNGNRGQRNPPRGPKQHEKRFGEAGAWGAS